MYRQIHVAERWGYVLRSASLGDFVVAGTSRSVLTQTLDRIVYYTPILYIAYYS